MASLKRPLLIVCFGLLAPGVASADMEGRTGPFAVETADKRFIFVMVKSCSREEIHFSGFGKYPESGMYINDGSTTPLWTVDWCGNVLLPSDGDYLVRRGPWSRASAGGDEEAITFFIQGRELKRYRVSDLIAFTYLLPHSASHYQWQRLIGQTQGASIIDRKMEPGGAHYTVNTGVVFDENAKTMTVETLQGDTYIFDYTTGEVLSAHRPVKVAAVGLAILFCLSYGLYLLRATSKPFKPFWKRFRPLFWFVLILTTSLTIVGVLLNRICEGRDLEEIHFATQLLWRLLVYTPFELLSELGWWQPWDAVVRVIQASSFWFVVSLILGITNNILVGVSGLIRRRRFGSVATNTC
jgi:hypothetical protein